MRTKERLLKNEGVNSDNRNTDLHIELASRVVSNWPDWKKAVYKSQSPRNVYRKSVTSQ